MVFAGLTWSCEDNEPLLSDFSDIGYFTSQFAIPKSLWAVNVTDFITFSDLSRSPISHQWIIPGEGAAFFLEGPITNNDTILTDFIINPGETVTEEETIHVLFAKPGLQTITLRNVFRDSVAFTGTDTLSAVLQPDGSWLYEEDFIIDVYDSITANARIFRLDGTEIPLGTDTIVVEGGDSLRFVDISTGRPNTWSWRIGSASASDSASTIGLNIDLGVHTAILRASRSGENIPGASSSFSIPNPIKVIPSSKPFQLAGPIVELEDQTIQVPLTGPVDSRLSLAGQEAFFSVTVNGTPFNVSSIQIDPDNNTRLNLTLAGTIYSDDEIFVSLADGSSIEASDTREIVPFSNEPVTMFFVNLFEAAGITYDFEDGLTGWSPSAGVEITNDAHTGNGAMIIRLNESGVRDNPHILTTDFTNHPISIDIDEDMVGDADNRTRYMLRFWYKVVGDPPPLEFRVVLQANNNGTWEERGNNWHGGSNTNNWIFREISYNMIEEDIPTARFLIRSIGNSDGSVKGSVIIDDMSLFVVDER